MVYKNLQPTICKRRQFGFTLIEVSIVLIVIGLVIGGVLVGQDLIKAAEVRATISQIESYNTATRTFQLKYGGLPGDISADLVTTFGFTVVPTRAGTVGQGDGNGILDDYGYNGNQAYYGACCVSGETAWFWEDLSSNSGLIIGGFNYAGIVTYPLLPGIMESTTPAIKDLIPKGKVGGTYVDVYSDFNGVNYFSLLSFGVNGRLDANGGISNNSTFLKVDQSYSIDKKMDDGFPQTGKVIAKYQNAAIALVAPGGIAANYGLVWASGGMVQGATDTSATPASSITCYDNSNVAGGVQKYSVGTNSGKGLNCALSFKMQ